MEFGDTFQILQKAGGLTLNFPLCSCLLCVLSQRVFQPTNLNESNVLGMINCGASFIQESH